MISYVKLKYCKMNERQELVKEIADIMINASKENRYLSHDENESCEKIFEKIRKDCSLYHEYQSMSRSKGMISKFQRIIWKLKRVNH